MESKSKVGGIFTGVLAIAAGIIIISFEQSMSIIIALAALAFGILQLVKYFRSDEQNRNIVVIVAGAILVIAGILVLVLPKASESIFMFVQVGVAVWAAANGIIWLIKCFKYKDNINPTVFIARIVLCLLMLGFAVALLVLAFVGVDAIMLADRIIVGCSVIVYGLAQLFMLD